MFTLPLGAGRCLSVDTALHLGGSVFIFFAPVSVHWRLFLPCSILAWLWTVSHRHAASLGMIGFHVLPPLFLMHRMHSFNLYIIYFFFDFNYFLHSVLCEFCLLSFVWFLFYKVMVFTSVFGFFLFLFFLRQTCIVINFPVRTSFPALQKFGLLYFHFHLFSFFFLYFLFDLLVEPLIV